MSSISFVKLEIIKEFRAIAKMTDLEIGIYYKSLINDLLTLNTDNPKAKDMLEEAQRKSAIQANRRIGKTKPVKVKKEPKPKKVFTPPTVQETVDYAKVIHEKNPLNQKMLKQWYEYRTDGEWKDKAGRRITNWKLDLNAWVRRAKDKMGVVV